MVTDWISSSECYQLTLHSLSRYSICVAWQPPSMGGVFHEAAASLGLKEASAIQVPEIWGNHELPLSNMQSVVKGGYWYHWLPMYLWLKSRGVWFWIIQCFLAFRGEQLGRFCKSFRKWRRNSSLIQLIWDWGKAKQPPGPAVNGVAAIQRAAACGSNEWSFISCRSCSIQLCRYDSYSDIHFYWIGLWMDCKFAFSSQLVQPTAANRLLDIFKTQGLLNTSRVAESCWIQKHPNHLLRSCCFLFVMEMKAQEKPGGTHLLVVVGAMDGLVEILANVRPTLRRPQACGQLQQHMAYEINQYLAFLTVATDFSLLQEPVQAMRTRAAPMLHYVELSSHSTTFRICVG